MVITISHSGYIKRVATTSYRSQRRGGRGLTGVTTKEQDFVEHLFVASTQSYLLQPTGAGGLLAQGVRASRWDSAQARGRSIMT